jgi:phosphonate transport system ATP-binding protein
MLEISDLVKTYPNGLKALHGVSLTVDRPMVVAIIGSSGAGKSTLIRCVNRLVEPTHGLRKARRHIGMIFQEYNLVERLTVMENVLSGRLGYVGFWRAYRRHYPPDDVAAAFEILDRVGLEGRENARADALSGGQRQRVGIARALMQRPNLLLVDEPTASLDPKTSRQIMRLIVELAHERSTPVLINIHDVALAQTFADHIVGLADGRVVFEDSSDRLTPAALTEIYGEEDWSTTIRKVEEDDETDGAEAAEGRNDTERGSVAG